MDQTVTLRFLSSEDAIAAGAMDMDRCIANCEEALALWSTQDAQEVPATYLVWDEKAVWRIGIHAGYIGGKRDVAGIKWVPANPVNPIERGIPRASALIILTDRHSGLPMAIMEGTVISAMRTAAVAGVGVKYLAQPGPRSCAAIGCGPIGRLQLKAVSIARSITRLKVFDLSRENAERFSEYAEAELGVENVEIVDTAQEAVHGADIVSCATVVGPSDAYIEGGWLSEGCVVLNTSKNDLRTSAFRDVDRVVVTDYGHLQERGSLARARKEGLISRDDVCEVGQIIGGLVEGRRNPAERIIFDAGGMGINDVINAHRVYLDAVEQNLGMEITLWQSPPWV